jgi:hypothetical protein
MVDSPTPRTPPKNPPKDPDDLSSGALKKPDDQSSGSPKSSDAVEGSGHHDKIHQLNVQGG